MISQTRQKEKLMKKIMAALMTLLLLTGCIATDWQYLKMSESEMGSLSDSELFDAAFIRTSRKVERFEDEIDGIRSLPHAAQVFYTVFIYDMEVNNGGLCQFFVNPSREIAPLLTECLDEIGAADHKDLFEAFVRDNGIDLNDLSSFEVSNNAEYMEQTRRFPYDDFDDRFVRLKSLAELLPAYIREHITDF